MKRGCETNKRGLQWAPQERENRKNPGARRPREKFTEEGSSPSRCRGGEHGSGGLSVACASLVRWLTAVVGQEQRAAEEVTASSPGEVDSPPVLSVTSRDQNTKWLQ